MSKFKQFCYLIGIALVVATPVVALCFTISGLINNSGLNSKVVYFNAIFLAAVSWWSTMLGKANDLKKFESSLSPTHESFLKIELSKMSNTIWGIIYFNIGGIVIAFFSALLGDHVSFINLPALSLYFLIFSFLLFIFLAPIKNRIESANVILAKREKEEKKKEEILKSLKSGIEKFEKDEKFEEYNIVVNEKGNSRSKQ